MINSAKIIFNQRNIIKEKKEREREEYDVSRKRYP